MKLDPKKVRFVSPFAALGIFGDSLRFVRGPKTVQLQETALVVEGNVLKVGLLGLEMLFRAALAEWTSVTIPYARITRVRFKRFPLMRILSLLVFPFWALMVWLSSKGGRGPAMEVFLTGLIPAVLAVYVFVRVSPRFVIDFRSRNGRRTRLLFHVTRRKLREEFARRLAENRQAAKRHTPPEARSAPTGLSRRATFAIGVLLLLGAMIAGLLTMQLGGDALDRFDPKAAKVKTKWG